MNAVDALTLSYTFFAAKSAPKPLAAAETTIKAKPQL